MSAWRQRGEGRRCHHRSTSERQVLEAKLQHVESNSFLAIHCLFISVLYSSRVALKNTRAKREKKAWSLGRMGVRGRGAGAIATTKPPPC